MRIERLRSEVREQAAELARLREQVEDYRVRTAKAEQDVRDEWAASEGKDECAQLMYKQLQAANAVVESIELEVYGHLDACPCTNCTLTRAYRATQKGGA